VKAVQAFPDGLRVQDVGMPEPGPGEVLVKVAGAGLCHSDCMISKVPQAFGRSDGMTIGHETAGWRVDTGQPVIVHAEFGCGMCAMCRRGAERFCPAIAPSRGAGQGHDGGMAEYMKVPARALVSLPDSIDPANAGPLDDAALTPYHAIRTSLPWLEPGNVVAVIGIGGLGHMAIQILRAMTSATIVAVERDERKRAFAAELGADVVLDPEDDAAAQIKSMGLEGASLVLDLVGNDQTLALAAASAARLGKIVCVGASLGTYPFSMITVPFETIVQTTYSGEAWELEAVVALAAAGKLHVEATHIGLDNVPEHLELIDRGEHAPGRLIAIP
jgi:alcohol dehydrogenase, propanol-preferring